MHASKKLDIVAMEVGGSVEGCENVLNDLEKLLIISEDDMLQ